MLVISDVDEVRFSMSGLEQTVVVHSFRCFDIDLGTELVPPFKATRHAIEHRFGGEALEITAEAVDPSELDAEGRWFRVASGWASL
jgi:hypothetical protein